jgi:hypothetical protein
MHSAGVVLDLEWRGRGQEKAKAIMMGFQKKLKQFCFRSISSEY